MTPLLAYDLNVGSGAQSRSDVVVFAHGILGSRSNWKSFARKFCESSGCSTLAVDLRNHGQSHGLPPPHSVQAAADDVSALCASLGLRPVVVVGHSWGGKAMLQMALDNAAVAVAVVVDAPFGLRRFGQGEEIDRVLDAVAAVSLPVPSRKALVDILVARGLSLPLAQWMTTNLNEQLRWKFDLAAIPPMLASFGSLDLWPAVLRHRPSLAVHVVRGGRSDRWSDGELSTGSSPGGAEFTGSASRAGELSTGSSPGGEEFTGSASRAGELSTGSSPGGDELRRLHEAVGAGVVVEHVLKKAAHWVHTDDPEGLLAVLLASLPP